MGSHFVSVSQATMLRSAATTVGTGAVSRRPVIRPRSQLLPLAELTLSKLWDSDLSLVLISSSTYMFCCSVVRRRKFQPLQGRLIPEGLLLLASTGQMFPKGLLLFRAVKPLKLSPYRFVAVSLLFPTVAGYCSPYRYVVVSLCTFEGLPYVAHGNHVLEVLVLFATTDGNPAPTALHQFLQFVVVCCCNPFLMEISLFHGASSPSFIAVQVEVSLC
ncbi:hypothetical protein V8G54_010805 [Vigna mungo]|uniref:Uncharacterized protein n=1 Tax=Vigna mungo TaxID=3915 RepID=A0AAQ3S650_VIGMU